MKHITYNKYFLSSLLIIYGVLFFLPVKAEQVFLRVEGPSANIVDTTVNLSESCLVTDTTPTTTPFDGHKAICILQTAQEQGLLNFQASNFGWGLFVDKINGIGGDENMFWSLYQNNSPALLGATDLPVVDNDKIVFAYINWNYSNEILGVNISSSTIFVNSSSSLQAQKYKNNEFSNLNSEVNFIIDGQVYNSPSGTLEYLPDAEGQKNIYVEAVGKTRSEKTLLTVLPLPPIDIPVVSTTPTSTETNTSTGSNSSTDSNTSTPPTENPPSGGNGGYTPPTTHNNLDTDRAMQFLISQEKADGAFGSSDLFTDWVAIALASVDKNSTAAQKTKNYLLSDPNSLLGMNKVADYARRAMALMSLGVNPYTDTKTNYINKLVEKFNGTQFIDEQYPEACNDDIFAIIDLLHSGYSGDDEIIQKATQFVLTKQTNGNWGSVDLTAAAIEALKSLNNLPGVNEAIDNAKKYLKNNQQNYSNGSFENSTPSTAWVIQTISALNENQIDWLVNNKTPGDFLYSQQANDGGVDETSNLDTRIWNTAYAIPAALNKDWNSILQNFSKFETPVVPNNSSNSMSQSASTTAPTTTADLATTTLDVATTTATTTISEQLATNTSTTFDINTSTNISNFKLQIAKHDSLPASNINLKSEIKNLKLIASQTTNNEQPPNTTISTPTTTGETLSSSTTTPPYESTARGVFATATTLASGLGIFLAWRLLQTLL